MKAERETGARSTNRWQFGLIGAVVLSLATFVKLVRALFDGVEHPVVWSEAAVFAAQIAGMGFVCGLVAWSGRGWHRGLGLVGDALAGAAVMVVFFVACMLLFDRELLGPEFASGGVFVLSLAVVVGSIGGPWIARDVRKHRARAPIDDDEEDEQDDE